MGSLQITALSQMRVPMWLGTGRLRLQTIPVMVIWHNYPRSLGRIIQAPVDETYHETPHGCLHILNWLECKANITFVRCANSHIFYSCIDDLIRKYYVFCVEFKLTFLSWSLELKGHRTFEWPSPAPHTPHRREFPHKGSSLRHARCISTPFCKVLSSEGPCCVTHPNEVNQVNHCS